MTILYPDVSSYQAGLRIQPNTVAVCAKASEGTTFHDPYYADFQAQSAQQGALFFAYHWLHRGEAKGQADFCHQIVGSTPVMVDWEGDDNPTMDDCVTFATELRARGGTCALLYLPHWYWDGHLGRPDLAPLVQAGLSLVSSNYTTYSDTGPGWASYGGMTPVIWQYTNSFPYGGSKVDFNAYRGTAEQLAALLRTGGGPVRHRVCAYQRANVRSRPTTNAQILSYVVAGECYPANCWTHGQTITDNGVTNDIWVQLPLRAGGVGYVSAVYLNGDEHGGLPESALLGGC